jgi:hypothetical protein
MRKLLLVLGFLLACGGDDDGGASGLDLSGVYFGEVTIGHDDPARSVFSSAELHVDVDGELAGSQVVSKSPSSTVGEEGQLWGRIAGDSVLDLSADLAVSFPTLGSFTLKGTMQYVESTRLLSGQLTARDAGGNVIGSAVVQARQE